MGEPAEEEPVDDGPEALIGARPGAAAVQQAGPAGVRLEPDSEVLADVGDVLRRRRRVGADRLHRLVRDDDLFPGGDVEQRFQLRETRLGGLRWGTALVLAHAVQRHQSLPDDLGNLRLDTGVVLAEKPSPLGMTNLDVPTSRRALGRRSPPRC